MQLGMIGLGRMGANMVERLMKDGHACVVNDVSEDAVKALVDKGARGTTDLGEFVQMLDKPRAVWLMVPAAIVDGMLDKLIPLLDADDIVIDGGNSYYKDDIRRAARVKEHKLHYVDVGVSGGVWGLDRGYSQMIGGEKDIVESLYPIFGTLAPGVDSAARTPGRSGDVLPEENGFLRCGGHGAGHFVKMVHNGIEYGIMAAFGEGFDILHNADIDTRPVEVDAETAPRMPGDHLEFDIDTTAVAEVWRRGTVIGSWLLDLSAQALYEDPELSDFSGRVSDSGEGRWTILAAIAEGTPAPLLSDALYGRFRSRTGNTFSEKIQSAMRYEFGGHLEKKK